MVLNRYTVLAFCIISGLSFSSHGELQDQGLNSIMLIIDKAIEELNSSAEKKAGESEAAAKARADAANATIVNLSRTLGTLSYSRLQCGEAGVLAEFTQRVQVIPEERRDTMRDAFQEGFDKSKSETALLSEDECNRLTQSRKRSEKVVEANVADVGDQKKVDSKQEEVVEEVIEADPKLRLLRIAELSGQLAYKNRFCYGDKVFNRDFNEYIRNIPGEYLEEVKVAYWKGFKRGKRLNKNLSKSQCS